MATNDPASRLIARGEADAEKKLLEGRIRKIAGGGRSGEGEGPGQSRGFRIPNFN
jgi:hypothetical protein